MTVKVGHFHRWQYRGDWQERKTRPGWWSFNFRHTKSRVGRQFKAIQGAPVGTVFTWGIRGIQRLTKVSPNRYAGHIRGRKKFIRRSR